MKLKRLPEDFTVEELTDLQPVRSGPYALYRLHKEGLGTLEAIEAIQLRWKIERVRMSWGGLKDKHAVTSQFLTIHRGPRRSLEQRNLRLEFLGWSPRPFEPSDIRGNRFGVVLRSLSPDDLERARAALPDVARDGLPNYFDDQRFGSLTATGQFIAEPWIKGDYERTLWLAFAEPSPFDRSEEKREKEILRNLWGQWAECKQQLARSHRRSIVTFLADRPGDFKGAWTRVNQDLRSLYLAAFQSALWNELLATLLREQCPAESVVEVPLKIGTVPFFSQLPATVSAALRELSLPLPSARIRLAEISDEAIRSLMERSLATRGLELREIRVKSPRDSFFSKGWRRAVAVVTDLQETVGEDELHAGRQALRLSFELPRGSYATILVKRLTDACLPPESAATRNDQGDDSSAVESDSDAESL